MDNLDIVPIPKDIAHLLTEERLRSFQDIFQLQSCVLQDHNIRIVGEKSSIDTAKRMAPAHFLGLRKKLFQVSSVTIQIPSSVEVGVEDLQTLIGGINIYYSLARKSVKLSGERQLVDDAKQRIEYFFNGFKGSSSHSPSPVPIREKEKMKPNSRNKDHECWFCNVRFTSKYFRTHVSSKCTGGYSQKLSFDERSEWIDEYYRRNGRFFELQHLYDSKFAMRLQMNKKVESSDENHKYATTVLTSEVQSPENDETISSYPFISDLLISYKKFLLTRSGSQGKSQKTQISRFNDVKRIFTSCNIETVEHLLSKTCEEIVTTHLDALHISDGTRYDYCLAIKYFLQYLKTEEEWVSGTIVEKVDRNIHKWNGCRASYQSGLLKERRILKHKEHRKMESGNYVQMKDIADCEFYFRSKLPKINRQSLTLKSLVSFYRWLSFALTMNNALRPSSIGNMKVSEYEQAFARGSTKVVVVEGYFKLFGFFQLFKTVC